MIMYGCESWTIKKAEYRRIDASDLRCWRRLLKVPWIARRSNLSILKKISPEYSLEGQTNAEAETPPLLPPDVKNWLIGKDPDAEKDWRQEEKGMTENEMAGWYHWMKGHEFEQASGVGDGQGSLACWSPWGRKESEMTNWTNLRASPLLLSSYYGVSVHCVRNSIGWYFGLPFWEFETIWILVTGNKLVSSLTKFKSLVKINNKLKPDLPFLSEVAKMDVFNILCVSFLFLE